MLSLFYTYIEIERQANINDKNRRFGVFAPRPSENKKNKTMLSLFYTYIEIERDIIIQN